MFGGPESAVAARTQAQFGNMAVNRQDFEQAQVAEYVSCVKTSGMDIRICDRLPGAAYSAFGGYLAGGMNRGEAVGAMTLRAESFRLTLAGSAEVNNLSGRMGANEAVDAQQGVGLRSLDGRISDAQTSAEDARKRADTAHGRVDTLTKASKDAFNGLARRVGRTGEAKPKAEKKDVGEENDNQEGDDDDSSSFETCPTEDEEGS